MLAHWRHADAAKHHGDVYRRQRDDVCSSVGDDARPPPLGRKRSVVADWPWTHPTYSFDVPTGSGIASVELDTARQMADVDRSNNRVEFDLKSTACTSAIANPRACSQHSFTTKPLGSNGWYSYWASACWSPCRPSPVHHGRRHSHHVAILARGISAILLGWRVGVAAVVAYLIIGGLGAPVFSYGTYGWDRFTGSSGLLARLSHRGLARRVPMGGSSTKSVLIGALLCSRANSSYSVSASSGTEPSSLLKSPCWPRWALLPGLFIKPLWRIGTRADSALGRCRPQIPKRGNPMNTMRLSFLVGGVFALAAVLASCGNNPGRLGQNPSHS